jgi:LmbE family N-acetylglucosaminyl deacetylase
MPINWNPTGRRWYLFTPHQDDEGLWGAQIIAHHVLAEREVHIVLLSNGNTSQARGEVNGTTNDPTFWQGTHDPAHENYAVPVPLSLADFGLERSAELRDSVLHLGVPPERVHYGMDLPSSDLLPDNVDDQYAVDVMRHFMNKALAQGGPLPGMVTTHWLDTTTDHANAGQALRHLRLNDPDFADSRWMVRWEQRGQFGSTEYVVPAQFEAEARAMQRRAALPYIAWRPSRGSLAIGGHSVYSLFEQTMLAQSRNWMVKTP